jgi:hypothetical protein
MQGRLLRLHLNSWITSQLQRKDSMKITILSIFAYLIPAPARAENTNTNETGILVKAGGNAATLAEDHRYNIYGFTGGIAGYLQHAYGSQFSLGGQLELLYVPRGAKVMDGNDYLGQSRSNYADAMLSIRPNMRLGAISLYVLLGGGLSLLVNARKENASGAEQDITAELHKIDVALLGGAGVAWHLANGTTSTFRMDAVILEARHDIGLLDTDLVNGGFKNRSSSLMLGLSFVVGGSPGGPSPP